MPLFRFLGADRCQWLLNDQLGQGTLAEFAARLKERKAVLVAPGETVTLSAVQVPGRSRAIRLKALPYVLEDNLIDDVENLYLVLDDTSLSTPTTVAIVRRHLLQDWLNRCREAGIALSAIVPDVLLLPDVKAGWSVLLDGERVLLRYGKSQGFACERVTFPLLLQQALATAGANKPEVIRVFLTPDEDVDELRELGIALDRQTVQGSGLHFLAASFNRAKPLDLLQGAGASQARAEFSGWLKPWRAAAVLSAVWLFVQGSIALVDYWRLSRRQAELTLAIEQVFKEAMPATRRIVNPRVQLATHLDSLRRGQSQDDAVFFQLLRHGGQTLRGVDEVSLRGLRYKDRQLDMDLEGGSPQQLDQLRQRLNTDPAVEAEMRTSKNDGKIESRIILRQRASS